MPKLIHILLVEDDMLDAIDIQRKLDKLGLYYQLHHVKNGEEALDFLLGTDPLGLTITPDIVLVDLNMPKMNGLELLETIRSHERLKDLKCFVITTSDDRVEKRTAEALQISGYIIKPLKLTNPSSMDAFNLIIDLMNLKTAQDKV